MKKPAKVLSLALSLCLLVSLCPAAFAEVPALDGSVKPATGHTVKINSAMYDILDFEDSSEYENATRGLIDAPRVLEIKDAEGKSVWSQEAYAFLADYETAPDSVNPSLWENTRNNHAYGLFRVTDGIYQVRGYDMANLTLIEGQEGWIVFDPLMSIECTQAAMALVEKNLGQRPVKAVIVSHPHVDHYGGIEGLISADDVADKSLPIEEQLASGKVPIIVPEDFEEHAVAENLYAGKAMSRRANYQYGVLLQPGVTGKLAMGIGLGQSTGTVGYLSPSYEISRSGESITIDGVVFEFQLTPGTEAPAEMNTWLPQFKALWLAENCTGTLHNLYTLRGAQVRDGAAWANYILEAIELYGDQVELSFQSHNWPHWGNETVVEYMENNAAIYKFINDQTLTYINQGYTSDEISNMIRLPENLEKVWYTRQYYGTLSHNSKAVYQKYMGWYDANPVNLDPLSPSDSAKKWVKYLGDTGEVLAMAKADFDKGEYQWVAEVTNVLVYADPNNEAARFLCADALEQLGYQAESGPWRNAYLTAALELRQGNQALSAPQAKNNGGVARGMSPDLLLGYLGILLNKQAMENENFSIDLTLTDIDEQYLLQIKNGVLLVRSGAHSDEAEVSVSCPKNALLLLLNDARDSAPNAFQIEGKAHYFDLFADNLNSFRHSELIPFNVIEP